ncbi:MAG: hypothetical protein A07HN63_01900 [uncultured archaeon A07HN63]|nr:MAG: hypothetical protein A07HN63_01900 [uncultured archaeon A07HN63]
MIVQFDLVEIDGIKQLDDGSKLTIITSAPAGGKSYKQASAPGRIRAGESYIL